MRNNIIEIQGNLFQVNIIYQKHQINLEKGSIDDLKLFFHCDTLFKAQGFLWVVNEIKEIEYEEIR